MFKHFFVKSIFCSVKYYNYKSILMKFSEVIFQSSGWYSFELSIIVSPKCLETKVNSVQIVESTFTEILNTFLS